MVRICTGPDVRQRSVSSLPPNWHGLEEDAPRAALGRALSYLEYLSLAVKSPGEQTSAAPTGF